MYILYVIVWHRHAEDTELWGHMFLTSKDLKNVRVNGLVSLVAYTRLGIVP